jgi:hypothetical protein
VTEKGYDLLVKAASSYDNVFDVFGLSLQSWHYESETLKYFVSRHLNMANLVEMNQEKVVCPQCRTEGKRSKVILYPGQTVPKMKHTDGYWDENGDFIEFNAEIKLPWYICSNGHVTPRDPNDRHKHS